MLQLELQLLRGYRLSPNCELELRLLADGGEQLGTYQRSLTVDAVRLSSRIWASCSRCWNRGRERKSPSLKRTCYLDTG